MPTAASKTYSDCATAARRRCPCSAATETPQPLLESGKVGRDPRPDRVELAASPVPSSRPASTGRPPTASESSSCVRRREREWPPQLIESAVERAARRHHANHGVRLAVERDRLADDARDRCRIGSPTTGGSGRRRAPCPEYLHRAQTCGREAGTRGTLRSIRPTRARHEAIPAHLVRSA